MKAKKIILIIILAVIVIGAIVGIILLDASQKKTNDEQTTQTASTKSGIDIKVRDNYYITQLNQIYYNKQEYKGKTIEIEGFPLETEEYKFVGRYGPGCCSGDQYAYIEYQYDKDIELEPEKDWIKVTGTLEIENDGGTDYIYIKASNIEKLTTRGKDTVSN